MNLKTVRYTNGVMSSLLQNESKKSRNLGPMLGLTFAVSFLAINAVNAVCTIENDVITQDIKTKITANKVVKASNVNVSTRDCVVFLSGSVKTDDEADTAIEIAASTPGVVDVDTESLLVKESAQPIKDSYITAKVKGALIREKIFGDKPISVIDVHVETVNGVVYLSGIVDPLQSKNAIQIAQGIKGVKSVESRINEK